ncbi:unnamed protein product [Didymodactylos carnosus]|nr:unnamed protein product [Didymodactylos carnosus]CAF4198409.1 unnamed protein product [Didymodactylos carnosus]
MIGFGVCDSIASFTVGYLEKYAGRLFCFIFAAIVNYSLLITMILWGPAESQTYVIFLIVAVWSLADAVWQTTGWAIYGTLFTKDDEAAFSNRALWEDTGYFIFFLYASTIVVRTSLILLLVYLTVSMICYGILELLEYNKRKVQPVREETVN